MIPIELVSRAILGVKVLVPVVRNPQGMTAVQGGKGYSAQAAAEGTALNG